MERSCLKILYLIYFAFIAGISAQKAVYLEQGDVVGHKPEDGRFQVYCYAGKPKYIIHIWQSVTLQIDLKNENYVLYDGPTPEKVRQEYQEHRSSWGISLFSWKQKRFKLDPFNQSCIGVDSVENYKVHLNIIRIDYWKVLALLFGIFLFVSAPKLSQNAAFYYICGISFGISASFIILIYFISRLFPRKPLMYGVIACGWTIGVYILQMIWENIRVILVTYQSFVVWYALITGLISFLVCYRMGPVSNKRTLKLIQWSLQAMGLFSIFFSSEFREASMGQICLLVILYNFPQRWVSKSKSYWKRRFPPKVELISNDEYYHQGVRETQKALDELRKYCSSPDCNQWKTILKLKEAKRFASFVEGQSHLSDEEILEYESSLHETELTEDEYTDEEEY